MGEQENDMTSKLEVVRAYADLIGIGGDMEAAIAYFSDDFQNLDKDGNVALTKEGFLGMACMISASFKDYGFVLSNLREEDDFVIMSGHFEGTHTGDLDLSAMGLGVVPASGKKIVWPEASAKLTVEGEKIVRMETYAGAAGLQAFLAALGVEPPSE
jgi:predicted ester cyclase